MLSYRTSLFSVLIEHRALVNRKRDILGMTTGDEARTGFWSYPVGYSSMPFVNEDELRREEVQNPQMVQDNQRNESNGNGVTRACSATGI